MRLALIHREIEGRGRSNGEAYAWVKRQEAGNNVHSLVSFAGVDLTRWSVDDKAYDLQPLYDICSSTGHWTARMGPRGSHPDRIFSAGNAPVGDSPLNFQNERDF
ncbi:MAG: hypothetical protein M3O74_05575 [Pseudomonadota bacterium]|nr:hypothetical protein [Pseudomonadota bacterium]